VGLHWWVVRASSSKYTHARNGLSFLRTGAVHVQAALHTPAKQGHRPVHAQHIRQNADANRLRLAHVEVSVPYVAALVDAEKYYMEPKRLEGTDCGERGRRRCVTWSSSP